MGVVRVDRAINVLTSSTPYRYVSSAPGEPRTRTRLHAGVDFPGQVGEIVLAMAPGVVRGAWASVTAGRGTRPIDVSPGRRRVTRARDIKDLAIGFGAGLYVELVHAPLGDGSLPGGELPLHTRYLHLDSILVNTGDPVDVGQPIGTLGSSGIARAHVHLHFETFLARRDAPVDAFYCLDPRGFQRWTSSRQLGSLRSDVPSTARWLAWPITAWVATPCFPASATARGRVGVDKPRALVGAPPVPRLPPEYPGDPGVPLVAIGPPTPVVIGRPQPHVVATTSPASPPTAHPLGPSRAGLGPLLATGAGLLALMRSR